MKLIKRPPVRALAAFCFLSGYWAFLSALITLMPTLESKIHLNRFKLVAPTLLPLSILGIALAMHGQRSWHKYIWLIFAVIPVISLLHLISPGHHEFMVGSYRLLSWGEHDLLAFSSGSWFKYHIINARFVVAMSILLLLDSQRDLSQPHRYRITLVILAILIPFLGDTFAVHALEGLRYVQLVPTLLLISALLLIYAIMRGHMIDVIPFARRHILDSMNDMYLIFDTDHTLVDFNHRAKAEFKLGRSALGIDHRQLAKYHPQLRSWLDLAEESNEETLLNHEYYEISRRPVLNSDFKSVGTVLAFKNITFRKKNEIELEHLNQLKTKLLAVIGHDFQGNLATSLIIAQTMARSIDTMKRSDRLDALGYLQKIAQENITLVEELLAWSKHRLDVTADREPVLLDEVAAKAVAFLSPLSESKKVEIQIDSNCHEAIRSDRASIMTILRNLLSNAIKFSPSGSRILLRLQQLPQGVEIMVEDQGPGIASDMRDTLFEVNHGSSGIGLFLCREFTERLGGRLWVDSEVGRGSRFYVAFPELV